MLRKGNFDMLLVGNVMGYMPLGRGWTASFRYSGATGRPYTPDNMALSEAQDRDTPGVGSELYGFGIPIGCCTL